MEKRHQIERMKLFSQQNQLYAQGNDAKNAKEPVNHEHMVTDTLYQLESLNMGPCITSKE